MCHWSCVCLKQLWFVTALRRTLDSLCGLSNSHTSPFSVRNSMICRQELGASVNPSRVTSLWLDTSKFLPLNGVRRCSGQEPTSKHGLWVSYSYSSTFRTEVPVSSRKSIPRNSLPVLSLQHRISWKLITDFYTLYCEGIFLTLPWGWSLIRL